MKKMNRWSAMITVMIICVALAVQASERLNTTYTYLTPSDGEFEDEVEQHEFKIEGVLPVMSADEYGFDLAVGAAYQANVWTFDNNRFDDLDLHKIKVPIAATFQATDEIPVRATLTPGIHSDFEDVDDEDFRLEGSVVGSYRYSEVMKFVLGVGFGEEFGDPEAFPIGGVSWQATDELKVDLFFPKPKISYSIHEDLRLYAAGEPAGGEWNVGEGDREFDVQQKGYRFGVGVEYQVADDGWLYAMVGGEWGREVSVAVNEEEIVGDQDVDDAVLIQIGFRLD